MAKSSMRYSLLCGVAALVIGLSMILFMPPDKEVKNLLILLAKLVPFALAAIAIALVDVEFIRKTRLLYPIVFALFLVYFCLFIPKIFFNLDDYKSVYYLVLLMTPYIILTMTLVYRMGGGSTGNCLRMAFSLLVLMLSGIEDLAFLTINHHTDPRWTSIPDVWTWASHMKVRLGHYPTKYEAYAFIAAHILLALVIAYFPPSLVRRIWTRRDERHEPQAAIESEGHGP